MKGSFVLGVALLFLLVPLVAPTATAAVPSAHAGVVPVAAGAVAAPLARPASPAAPHPPASNLCPTPQNLADWTSSIFFDDALVAFTVPGYSNLSGANFETVPCDNNLPTYLPGFWMNISTNVPLTQAYLNVWGTLWPTPHVTLADLPGFPYDQTTVTTLPMYIAPGAPDQASFYFNTHRFFFPGSTVYFNVTLKSAAATPSTINSANELSSVLPPIPGVNLNATWQFTMNAPWWSPTFASDIAVLTTPSVLSSPVYDPNVNQSLGVTLESLAPSGLPGTAIPTATLNFIISNDPGLNGTYGVSFGPGNHTFQNLTNPIGQYPGATIEFNISAWLPWENGAIDKITSPDYWFNWSRGGGWPAPSLGLESNALISANPNVLTPTTTTLATATPVNLTVTESLPNVTIDSSIVRFHYADAYGGVTGVLPMHPAGQHTTYVVIPGLPAGARLTFSVLAKDVFDNPLTSGNYTYVETGTPTATLTPFASFFYIEGINATTDTLLTGASFTVSNASWSQSGVTGVLGFGILVIPNGGGNLQLPFGTYSVSMHALEHMQTAKVSLVSSNPITVRFWFANGPVAASSDVPLSSLTVGLVAGLVLVTVALFPLLRWFKERLKKAEAERTRVTL
ncbi:MAG: hypothetical protein L3K10_02770 [Thermoplasmata archaeon]|nr:hypothetical protein [Thermoplasmata archaeon]